LPARTFRNEFQDRGIQPQVLSRTVEDTGTVTSPLVPWNSCGAYMAGTLGVATLTYLPFAFLNLINPVISMVYAATGFQVKYIERSETEPTPLTAPQEPTVAPPRDASAA
jgi:NhaC family Na+:H+ antiporter